MKQFIIKHKYLMTFFAVNVIFLILYSKFVLFEYAYMYTDIGSDTMAANYPNNVFFSNLFHSGDFSSYALNYGLGKDITSTFIQYLNPINLLLIAFPRDLLVYGIMVVTFVKLNLISFFGHRFFRHLTNDDFSAFMGAVCWTFSSYVVLWGQHYGFCTAIMMFTICIFFLQLFLEGNPVGWKILIPLFVLFIMTNYYFFYMSGIFFALYLIIYLAFTKKRALFKKLFGLLGIAVLSLVISAFALIPIVNDFTSSTRTASLGGGGSLFSTYEGIWYLTFIGRLFSNNTFGSGNNYTGVSNYYEVAMLFTSALFIFAFVYLLLRKNSFAKTIITAAICLLMLTFTAAAKVLIFNAASQRFSFIICFAEVIAICFFFKCLRQKDGQKGLIPSLVISPLICMGLVAILYLSPRHMAGEYALNVKALAIFAAFALAYWLILLVYRFKAKSLFLTASMSAILIAEMICTNYDSLYDRSLVTMADFKTSYYNNGSDYALEQVAMTDDDIYRASEFNNCVDYGPSVFNMSMAQGYNGTNYYSSTVPSSLISYSDSFDIFRISNNFFDVGYQNYYIYTLLGGRYLMADKLTEVYPDLFPDSDIFDLVYEDADSLVYENKYALPFGYIYEKEIDSETYSNLDSLEKQKASTTAFYYTEGEDNDDIDFESVSENAGEYETTYNLLDYITETSNCEVEASGEGIKITVTGDSPYIVADVPEAIEEGAYYFTVSGVADNNTYIFFLTEGTGQEWTGDNAYALAINDSIDTASYLVPNDATRFRLNIDRLPENSEFTEYKLVKDDDFSGLEKLSESAVTDISFQNDTYKASVNVEGEKGMLCIPILYDDSWSATVNGEPADVQNINGGLCGIALSGGTYDVEMHYTVPHMKTAAILSIAGAAVYVLLIIYENRRRKQDISSHTV